MQKYLLLLFSICAFAQEPAFKFAQGSDVEIYPEIREQNKKLGYDPIEDDNNDYSFRLSHYDTAITVYKRGSSCFGSVVYNVYETNEFGDKETGKKFKMTFSLTPQEAKSVMELIEETKVDSFPTHQLIPVWSQFPAGVLYTLQHKRNSIYSLKTYTSPDAVPDSNEAVQIDNFIKKLADILNLLDSSDKFKMQIPFKTYSNGDGSASTHFKVGEKSRRHLIKLEKYIGG